MDRVVDFTNCKTVHRSYGGSDRKFGVVHNGETYMLKFSEHHAKRHDISTSYVNNVVSEYISSHIAQSIGIPTHETVLGIYEDELVVGCKDFRGSAENYEFSNCVKARYGSKEVGRLIILDQIYETLKDPRNDIPESLQRESIQRYWDTFVIDSLVGNFDRHIGNWGYLTENNMMRLAPAYDFGSTLFPNVSDIGAEEFMKTPFKMFERCLVFPSPALAVTNKKVGKVGYYDMMSSNYDHNCTKAVLDVIPKINMEKIRSIIDDTPLITEVRKEFYKSILQLRKEIILDRAYLRCLYQEYDKESLSRIQNGHQFSDGDLELFLRNRSRALHIFDETERKLDYANSADYILKTSHTRSEQPIDKDALINEQRHLMEEFGFHSKHVWARVKAKTKIKDRDGISHEK